MMYLGNYAVGATIDFMWSSNDSTGASITRGTNGTISVYKGNSTTQSTAGVTDTEDFDSLTGIHQVRITTASDGSFYAAGNDFMVVLSGATIDGKAVNGVLAHFSLQNRYPAVADNQSGLATAAALAVVDDFLDTEIAAIKAKTDNLPSDPADDSDIDAQLAAIAGYLDTEIAAIKAKTDNLPSDPADDSDIDAQLAAIAGYLDTEIAAIKAKTDNLPASPAAVGSAMTLATGAVSAAALATDAAEEIADTLLKRDWSAVTGEASRSVLNALRFLRNKWTAVGTTLTVMKEDDSTAAWTGVLTKDASSDPITGSDPA